MNYYIIRADSIGSDDLLARYLALCLNKDNERKPNEELYFSVSSSRLMVFIGYDGQPVLIGDEFRAETLINVLVNRENIFDVFGLHPSNTMQKNEIWIHSFDKQYKYNKRISTIGLFYKKNILFKYEKILRTKRKRIEIHDRTLVHVSNQLQRNDAGQR